MKYQSCLPLPSSSPLHVSSLSSPPLLSPPLRSPPLPSPPLPSPPLPSPPLVQGRSVHTYEMLLEARDLCNPLRSPNNVYDNLNNKLVYLSGKLATSEVCVLITANLILMQIYQVCRWGGGGGLLHIGERLLATQLLLCMAESSDLYITRVARVTVPCRIQILFCCVFLSRHCVRSAVRVGLICADASDIYTVCMSPTLNGS